MLLEEIKQQVKSGKLKLERTENGTATRRLRIYSKTKGEWLEYPEYSKKTGKIEMVKKWCGDFENYKTITYPRIHHRAMIDKHQGYKISKKVYNELVDY